MIDRWSHPRLRRMLQPPSATPLRRWIALHGGRLSGRVLNVGSGDDDTRYGDSPVRVDRFAPRQTVRAALEVTLPFRSQVFDGAVCTEVIEHVPGGEALLTELARVLKTGGRLVVTVPSVFPYHPDPRDLSRLTPEGLGDALARAGFDVEWLGGIGGRVMLAWLMVESLHPVFKLVMRLLIAPVRAWWPYRRPKHRVWSPWALHAVAVARRRSEAPPDTGGTRSS